MCVRFVDVCMSVCVYVHVRRYLSMYVCIVYVCITVFMCGCVHYVIVGAHVCMCVCMWVHVCLVGR